MHVDYETKHGMISDVVSSLLLGADGGLRVRYISSVVSSMTHAWFFQNDSFLSFRNFLFFFLLAHFFSYLV